MGNAFRDSIAAFLRQQGFEVETEVYKRTPFGGRFIDIQISRNGTVMGGFEIKRGDSPYKPDQRSKDRWLSDDGYPVWLLRE